MRKRTIPLIAAAILALAAIGVGGARTGGYLSNHVGGGTTVSQTSSQPAGGGAPTSQAAEPGDGGAQGGN